MFGAMSIALAHRSISSTSRRRSPCSTRETVVAGTRSRGGQLALREMGLVSGLHEHSTEDAPMTAQRPGE